MNKSTVSGLFETYASQSPEHIAVISSSLSLTYGELNNKANQLASYLQNRGAKCGEPIAVCLPRSFDFLIAIVAILKSGCAYLPIDASQSADRLLFILNDSKASLLITDTIFSYKFERYPGQLILLDAADPDISQGCTQNLDLQFSSENLAYIIYTSGSTGLPKGVLIEHSSVVNYGQWFQEYTGCQVQQRIDFSSFPIFDMSVSVTIVPLILGLTVVICQEDVKKNTRDYLRHLADTGVNIAKMTPSYFKVLLQEAKNDLVPLPCLQSIVLGGENLPASPCQSWLALYPHHVLFNEYGPTETTVAVCAHRVTHSSFSEDSANIPIGSMGNNMRFIIVDEQNKPVSEGEIGELLVGGLCLARGYLNRAELTLEKFIKDPFNGQKDSRLYRTGDLCRKRPDGVLEYFGRIDEQVKIRGFRVEPGEVEQHLVTYPAINMVAVVSQKDTFEEQQLVAYYLIKESHSTPSSKELREFLQERLPEYMIPSAFIEVDSLPLTANGKLDKLVLPKPQFEISPCYIKPTTELEKQLCIFWSEELGLQDIGLKDDFFELGGHSLAAARLVSKINHQLHINITLHDFYQACCIANLVPIIQKATQIEQGISEINYDDLPDAPLTDFQFVLWMADTFDSKVKELNIVSRKRFQGFLDKTALELAFEALFKKHEVLFYRILKFKPSQYVQKNLPFHIDESHIEYLSEQGSEKALEQSRIELMTFHSWPKNAPLLLCKLFYLRNHVSELQLCMPHLITDDVSMDILFNDLSKFYLRYKKKQVVEQIKTDTNYKKYIFDEQNALASSLDTTINFWEDYLKDASFFSFPEKYVVQNMQKEKLSYSTEIKIPKAALNNLTYFCEQNHVSINNGLCAILALALHHCSGDYQNKTPYTVMNIIKSTRDNPIYNQSIGCFLRVDPVKIAVGGHTTVTGLSKQIRESIIETSNYQQSSNLIKLTSVSTLNASRKKIQPFFINLLTPLFAKILKFPSVYRKILPRCMTRLMSFKRHNHFIVNLNVRNNFTGVTPKKTLFGLKNTSIKHYKEELLAVDYVFEACFFYDENQKTHYLVISANLRPEFRKKIANKVVSMMKVAVPEEMIRAQEQP